VKENLNYLNNILAKIEATNAGVQEALMLSAHGYVAECTGDNIFVVKDGRIYTPPPVSGENDKVAGGLLVTSEWSDWRCGWWWWLQSVYVRPGHRGRGVFGALLAAVRAEATATPDTLGLRLYVEQDNRRAQAVYAACGFEDARYRVFERARTQ